MKSYNKKLLRSFALSLVIFFCIITAFIGIFKAYENISLIGFGQNKKAIELGDGFFRILDFTINL